MPKILAVVPDRCFGCQRCELHCSFFHHQTHKPTQARIKMVRYGPYVQVPVICVQCGLCKGACPVPGAMKRDTKTGAIMVTDKCNGCGQCVSACPYGVIFVDSRAHKAMKCDLCGGDPCCAKHCPFNALVYVELEKAVELRSIMYALGGRRGFLERELW